MNSVINEQPYAGLTPEVLLAAVDSFGLATNGSFLALNSYENRVYQIGLEDQPPVVVKFYRAARWTDAQIQEEHDFAFQLAEYEIPVITPLRNPQGNSLCTYQDYRFAVYPRKGGRAVDLTDMDQLHWLGRLLGRLHAVSNTRSFLVRPTLDIQTFGQEPVDFLLQSPLLRDDLRNSYQLLTEELLKLVRQSFAEVGATPSIRLHGDFHIGNVLWTNDGPHFVDLDDARMGPAVQDLWMLLSGRQNEMRMQISEILDAYDEFYAFNIKELRLIEPLRTLRMIHYVAWLARRWNDPAFPHNFPWFVQPHFWDEHLNNLREQKMILEQGVQLQLY